LPTVVLVLVLTAVVPAETADPRDEEAVVTTELVLALITAASEDEAVLVLPLTTAAIDEEAVVTSDWRARAPLSSPAPVRVRVVLFHTSATRVPNEERVLPDADQIAVGSVAKREEEALPMVVLTEAVPATVPAAREVEALVTVVLTEAVPAVTADPSEDEAVPTILLVFALMTDASEDDAVVTSDWRARVPASRVASDKRRVA
jgi:hypothetical protein